jgi:hypothetical protein
VRPEDRFLAIEFVGADILEPMEFVKKNVLISLCSTTIEGLVPVTPIRSKASKTLGDFYQEFPARFVNCFVRGSSCTFAARAMW